MTTWLTDGTALLLKTVDGLSDAELHEPSALPGWTRRHLLAHVALNAEALARLVSWARTGVESRMYRSAEQRNADIESGARISVSELREWVHSSVTGLAADLATLPEDAWSMPVATAQGRRVPATEIPWMRAREVNIHAIDLGTGLGFADLPDGFCPELVGDIAHTRSGTGPALVLASGGREWQVAGTGEPTRVELAMSEMAAWLAGRHDRPDLPELPKWL
ncbi:maleylpyruvate isomerase family mycothiol-dependent enzyme [Pseudonocardia spinosispora]|uniref:maleylpyruvate isomerase family mycothiol-dependent enzyme n=1 Tax=Pseudonocardia spinosispora TaxID=103441 RepID=UPI00040A0ED6|nr:maleylpyruvate isomerase family mycothiol-dependent enzyme [Pseudonocardia spinosispora]